MKKLVCILVVMMMGIFLCPVYSSEEYTRGSKMTEDLLSMIDSIEAGEAISVYVYLYDLDDDNIMEEFAKKYPVEYNEYCLAMFGYIEVDGTVRSGASKIDLPMLQKAIKAKRSLYAEKYYNRNKSLIDKYFESEEILFVSKYSPMIIASINKETLYQIEASKLVQEIALFSDDEYHPELQNANIMSGAAAVRNGGYKGAGIIMGQLEQSLPDIGHSDLQYVNKRTNGSYGTDAEKLHATKVARIMVGHQNGITPQADLYSASFNNTLALYEKAEWLITEGVNIINMSTGGSTTGKYDSVCKWMDHIAYKHNVHVVKSAGNTGQYISSPGMAYNIITVGGFNDKNNTNAADDEKYTNSSYLEYASSARPEKPNLIADAVNVYVGENSTGTSFAAAQVSGVIAQLCSADNSLLVRQSEMGAILATGSTYKLEGETAGHYYCDFISSVRVVGSSQISIFEGAGKLNASNSLTAATNGKHSRAVINTEDFPYTITEHLTSSSSIPTRIAIFWLKRNSFSSSVPSSAHPSCTPTCIPISNLTLKVYAPNGTQVAISNTSYSNFEIVQFYPTQTGNYRIVISKASSNSSSKEYVGISVLGNTSP